MAFAGVFLGPMHQYRYEVKMGEPNPSYGHILASEISPEDSVLKRPADLPPPRCNLRGIMLDNHVGRGSICERCGAQKGR